MVLTVTSWCCLTQQRCFGSCARHCSAQTPAQPEAKRIHGCTLTSNLRKDRRIQQVLPAALGENNTQQLLATNQWLMCDPTYGHGWALT